MKNNVDIIIDIYTSWMSLMHVHTYVCSYIMFDKINLYQDEWQTL